MISSKEYKSLFSNLKFTLPRISNIDYELIEKLDDIRIAVKKYIKEAEYRCCCYPESDLTQLNLHRLDIIEMGKEIEVYPYFYDLDKERRIDNKYIKLRIREIDITNIIVF